MKIGFLVYDSRSGSTLLSRLIMERLADVAVTQEIGFERLWRAAAQGGGKVTRDAARHCLKHDYLRNLELSRESLESLLDKHGAEIDVAVFLKELLAGHVQAVSGNRAKRWILIKYGRHVLSWKAIQQVLGRNTLMLHVVRDPRAVISSKLRTVRPYYPFETLAWGGSLLAAVRWKAYCQAFALARQADLPALEMRYEDLVEDPEGAIATLQTSLGIAEDPPRSQSKMQQGYVIPNAERTIHARVAEGAVQQRTLAWRDELRPSDRRRVEALLVQEMSVRGYATEHDWSTLERWRVLASSAPDAAWRTARHYARHAWRRIGGRVESKAA